MLSKERALAKQYTVNTVNDHEGSYINGHNLEQPVIHRAPQNPLPVQMDKAMKIKSVGVYKILQKCTIQSNQK